MTEMISLTMQQELSSITQYHWRETMIDIDIHK